MQLHNIKSPSNKKKKKKIGRGGKRGTYSGRGIKGQKSRAGHSIPSQIRDIIQHFPKLRGVKFKTVTPGNKVINVGNLEKLSETDIITKKSLEKAGIIKKNEAVKILGDGEVKKAFTIKDILVSKSAKEKIEKAGGKVINE